MTTKLTKISIFLLLAVAFPTFGQDESKDKAEREAWTKYYVQQLSRYHFFTDADTKNKLPVIPEAKLRWDNPVRVGRTHGELYVWTNQGRGAVVGNLLSYDFGEGRRRVAHEFHSFSEQPLTCKHDSGLTFEMKGPGVEFEPIPGAPRPSKSRRVRLAQMRDLSKNFRASSQADDRKTMRPLRALNQPLFRFETKEIDDDGAIFAYVTGTDPELLVAIVTKKTKSGPRWHFGAGRYSDLPLTLSYKTETVWDSRRWSGQESGYHARHGIDVQPHMPNLKED